MPDGYLPDREPVTRTFARLLRRPQGSCVAPCARSAYVCNFGRSGFAKCKFPLRHDAHFAKGAPPRNWQATNNPQENPQMCAHKRIGTLLDTWRASAIGGRSEGQPGPAPSTQTTATPHRSNNRGHKNDPGPLKPQVIASTPDDFASAGHFFCHSPAARSQARPTRPQTAATPSTQHCASRHDRCDRSVSLARPRHRLSVLPPTACAPANSQTLDPTASAKRHGRQPAAKARLFAESLLGRLVREGWWAVRDSNSRHPRCKRGALPTELTAHRARPVCLRRPAPGKDRDLRRRTDRRRTGAVLMVGPFRRQTGQAGRSTGRSDD